MISEQLENEQTPIESVESVEEVTPQEPIVDTPPPSQEGLSMNEMVIQKYETKKQLEDQRKRDFVYGLAEKEVSNGFDVYGSSEEGFSRESFKDNNILVPEERYRFYNKIFPKSDSERPSWEEFSELMLEGEADEGFENFDGLYGYSDKGVRYIDSDTGQRANVVDRPETPNPVKMAKDMDLNYQMTKNSVGQERADELWELNAYKNKDNIARLTIDQKNQQEFEKARKETNMTLPQFHKANNLEVVNTVGGLMVDRDEATKGSFYFDEMFEGSNFWLDRTLTEAEQQRRVENNASTNLYKVKTKLKEARDLLAINVESTEAQAKVKQLEKEQDDLLLKYSEDTDDQAASINGIEKQYNLSLSEGNANLTIGQLTSLSQIIFEKEPEKAQEFIEPFLDRMLGRTTGEIEDGVQSSMFGFKIGDNQVMTLSEDEQDEVNRLIGAAKRKVASRNNQKAVDYSIKDYASAVDDASSEGLFETEYTKGMSDEQAFFYIYKNKHDEFKALEKELGGRRGIKERQFESNFNFGDDEEVYSRYSKLENYLLNHYSLFALNINDYDAETEGFFDAGKKFLQSAPTKIADAFYEKAYGDNKYDTKATSLTELVAESPEVEKKAVGEFKNDVMFVTNAEGSVIPNYDEFADLTGVAAEMMFELQVGSGVLSLAGNMFKGGRLLSQLSRTQYEELAPALKNLYRNQGSKYGLAKFMANNPMAAKNILGATKRGAQYQLSGEIFGDTGNLNFANGLGGYAGAAIAEKYIGNALTRLATSFGKDSPAIVEGIIKYGQTVARLGGHGGAEFLEEEGENIADIAMKSSSMSDYFSSIKSQYGDIKAVTKRFVSSFTLGALMGNTKLGETYTSKAMKQLGDARAYIADYKYEKGQSDAKLKEAQQIVEVYEAEQKNLVRLFDDAAEAADLNKASLDETKEEIDNVADSEKKAKVKVEETEGKDFDKETEALVKDIDKDTIEKLNALKSTAESSLEEANTTEEQKETEVNEKTSERISDESNNNPLSVPRTNKRGNVRNRTVNRSDLSKASSIVINGVNSGNSLDESINEAATEMNINPNHLKRVMSNELSKKTQNNTKKDNPEIDQLIEDVVDMQEDGTLFDNIDEGVVLTKEDGTEVEGDLEVSSDGDIMFKPKGKKGEGMNLGNENEVGGQYLAEVGLAKTNKAGEEISRKKKVTGEKNKYVARSFPKERDAFNKFNKKVKNLKKRKDKGSINENQYNAAMQKIKSELEVSVPDIAGQITEDTDLEAFNDLLLSERVGELNSFYKDRAKKRVKMFSERVKEVAKEGKAEAARLKEKVSEFKKKQKELDAAKSEAQSKVEAKERQIKEAKQKVTNAKGDPIKEMIKEDGSKYTPEELKAAALTSVNFTEASEYMMGLRAYDLDIDFINNMMDSFVDTDGSYATQLVIAEIVNSTMLNRGYVKNTSKQMVHDIDNSGGTLQIAGSKTFRALLNTTLKIAPKKSRKGINEKVDKFLGIGTILDTKFPELGEVFGINKREVVSREARASKLGEQLLKLQDKYLKNNSEVSKKDFLTTTNNMLLGLAPIDSFGKDIGEKVSEMRDMSRELHAMLVEMGLQSESAFTQMQEDGTFYMTNTYKKFFKNSDWNETVKEMLEAGEFDNVREYFKEDYAKENYDNFNEKTEEEQSKMVDNQIIYLSMNPNELTSFRGVGSNPMAYGHKSLKKRKQIDQLIKDVMGEVKDPYVNFLTTIGNQATIIKNHKNRQSVLDYALKNNLAYKVDDKLAYIGKGKNKKLNFKTESQAGAQHFVMMDKSIGGLAEDGTVYIDNTLYETIKAYDESSDRKFTTFNKFNSIVKQLNTVYSPSSHMRNVMGAMSTTLSMGQFSALSVSAIRVFIDGDKGDSQLYDAMTKLGVIDAGISQEVFALLKDTKEGKNIQELMNRGESTKAMASVTAFIQKKFVDFPRKAYQATDNLARVNGFIHFLRDQSRIAQANPDSEFNKISDKNGNNNTFSVNFKDLLEWSRTKEGSQSMLEASRETDAYYPTYRKLPRALRWTNENIPFLGTFTSFPAESLRTSYNMYAGAISKIGNAVSSDTMNTKQKAMAIYQGVKRMSFALGTQLLFAELAYMSLGLVGMSEEEEKLVRNTIPEWDRDSNLYFFYNDEGMLEYVNLDVYNSYGYPKDIFMNVSKGEISKSIGVLTDPFISKNMFFNFTQMLFTGKDDRDNYISSPYASFTETALDRAGYIGRRSTGSIGRYAGTIWDANMDIVDKNGDLQSRTDYNGKEISATSSSSVGRFFGVTRSTVSLDKPRFAKDEIDKFSRISNDLNNLESGSRNTDAGQLENINKGTLEFARKARDINKLMTISAERQGNDPDKASDDLRTSLRFGKYALSKKDWSNLIQNEIDMKWVLNTRGEFELKEIEE